MQPTSGESASTDGMNQWQVLGIVFGCGNGSYVGGSCHPIVTSIRNPALHFRPQRLWVIYAQFSPEALRVETGKQAAAQAKVRRIAAFAPNTTSNGNCPKTGWRPEPESNRRARICSPLRNHSAIGPSGGISRGKRALTDTGELRNLIRPDFGLLQDKRSNCNCRFSVSALSRRTRILSPGWTLCAAVRATTGASQS